ncbi:NAD(+) diphosphatase [Anaerotalea alkaliphila]|uniref:NAD(+) diphosphatase n=1 Tax=Anaerotalea alkaliphila TaxID=2662126 RepID=A0A7X5KN73_9FIRM|nr:NAD(+) diphosphatase [Anaerotalea alkaliphila]NDL67739.1 NAD(+) diphosphatase [Anaerotalea alkaliphila]
MVQEMFWMLFSPEGILVLRDGEGYAFPEGEWPAGGLLRQGYVGVYQGREVRWGELAKGFDPQAWVGEREILWTDLRALAGIVDSACWMAAGRAYQLMDFERTHLYCGRCGTPTEKVPTENARACPACGLTVYPRIAPATITAILSGDRILLAHNKRFANNVYSLVAGFVEPSETFEECAAREIREEVGVEVENIRYFGSQTWPFPHSIMVGMVADHAGGEIVPDGEEIDDARWFGKDDLPNLPPKVSIARKMIDAWLAGVLR